MGEARIQLKRIHKVAVVTMNHLHKKNAFDADMFSALEQVSEALKKELPRAVVLTGAGDEAFSSGFDVGPDNPMVDKFLSVLDSRDNTASKNLIQQIRKAVDRFTALPVPLIAAINGAAYGGGAELATRCDLRVMDETAQLCFSEVRLGLMPDWGGGPSLTRLIGSGAASDLILTARPINSREALDIGLVNRVVKKGQAKHEALSLGEQIAQNGPRAVQHALKVIRKSLELPLEKALDLETDLAAKLIVSGECLHGITAFMEGKPPEFPD